MLEELRIIAPEIVVPLGATAAKALLGSAFRVSRERGQVLDRDGQRYVATVHPSAILRGPPEDRGTAFQALVADLTVVAGLL